MNNQTYYEKHREDILKYQQEYYEKHREGRLQYQREYNEANKDRVKQITFDCHKQKYSCVCGKLLRKNGKKRHDISKDHIKYIAENTK